MSEIGVIGQMYEDRRTKKRGKLIERDNKFKTLLMESKDGKSFNITFGGFKSNWRKIDESIQTVEEAMQEEVPEEQISLQTKEAPVKKNKTKTKTRKPQAPRQINIVLEETMLHILDYAKSFNSTKISTGIEPKKRNIRLKVDNTRMFILTYMARRDKFMVCLHERIFLQLRNKDYVSEAKFNESWQTMKYSFIIEDDELDDFLDDMREFIERALCNDIEEV